MLDIDHNALLSVDAVVAERWVVGAASSANMNMGLRGADAPFAWVCKTPGVAVHGDTECAYWEEVGDVVEEWLFEALSMYESFELWGITPIKYVKHVDDDGTHLHFVWGEMDWSVDAQRIAECEKAGEFSR